MPPPPPPGAITHHFMCSYVLTRYIWFVVDSLFCVVFCLSKYLSSVLIVGCTCKIEGEKGFDSYQTPVPPPLHPPPPQSFWASREDSFRLHISGSMCVIDIPPHE